jgi:DNA mismatch endonuclease (patch repair protein)
MVDNLKPEDRRRTMQAVKGKKTRLEKRLFSMLAGMSLKGWKQNVSHVCGNPDVAFIDERVAIFVDGCFWHGCSVCQRKLPQTNREYWKSKIARNVKLANCYNRQLRKDGWTVIRIWEHEITCNNGRQAIRSKIRQNIKPGNVKR